VSFVSRGRQVIAIGVGVAVVAWVGAAALLYAMQDAMVFPVPGGIDRDALDAAAAEVGARPMDLVASDGVRSYAWLRSVGADRLVVYFPGNRETVADSVGVQRLLLAAGFDVLVMAERGYPGSEGKPSEAGFALDARAAWAWATGPGGFAPDRIVLHGHSLGGGVAAELAEAENPCGLVLESTFSSLVDLAAARYPIFPVRPLLRSRFETDKRAPRLGVPVLILHSTADRTVPIAYSAVHLAPLLAEGEVHVVDDVTHADSLPVVDAGIRQAWLAFLERVAPRR
jgi:fermentation-respiration switch protein FrsA (DUF1100 family)